MTNGDVFASVRQRAAAFKAYKEHCSSRYGVKITIEDEDEYLDAAYRFLNKRISKEFIELCAKSEGMAFEEYCKSMGIDQSTDF